MNKGRFGLPRRDITVAEERRGLVPRYVARSAWDDNFEYGVGSGGLGRIESSSTAMYQNARTIDFAGSRRLGAMPWMWRNQGSSFAKVINRRMKLEVTGTSGDSLRVVEQIAPSGEFSAFVDVRMNINTGLFIKTAGIALIDDTSGRIITVNIAQDRTSFPVRPCCQVVHWNSVTSFNAIPVNREATETNARIFVRRRGSNIEAGFSDYGRDDEVMYAVHIASETGFLTNGIQRIGLYVLAIENGAPFSVMFENWRVKTP